MKKVLCSILPVLLCSSLAWGQTGFSARSMGVAGAYQSTARGAEVSSWNAANLLMPGAPRASFDFLSIGFSVGNNSVSLNDYNAYFTENEQWDDAAKSGIMSLIPSDGMQGFNRAQFTPAAISWHQYALAVNSFAYADVGLPKNIFNVMLYGLGTDQVNINDIQGEAVLGTEIALSGARRIDTNWSWTDYISVGATFKFLIGHGYANARDVDGSVLSNTEEIAVYGDYKANVVAPWDDKGEMGFGVGFDVGAAAMVGKNLTVGLALHNIFGSITFNGSEEYIGSYELNEPGLNIEELDNFGDYIDSVSVENDTSYASDAKITYVLPKSLLLSGNYRFSDKIAVELDYHQGLNTTAGGTTTPRIAVGAEYRFWHFLPTRLGFALGGIQGTTLACGFGLDLGGYKFDFAIAGQRGLFNGSKGLNMAISHRIFF